MNEAVDDDPATDNGACSLREAVLAANANAPVDDCAAGEPAPTTDVIEFAPSLDGTPTVLSLGGTGEDNAMAGDLDITEDIEIIGNGSTTASGAAIATLIDADGIDRVIDLPAAGVTAAVERLVIAGGASVDAGAGIRTATSTSLTLRNVQVTDNIAGAGGGTVEGGGIRAAGDLVIENSALANNAATATGGGLAAGAGVFASADLAMRQCFVAGNQAQTDDGSTAAGGILFDGPDMLVIEDSQVIGNGTSTTTGGSATAGGLRATGTGNARIERSTFALNTVAAAGSGLAFGGGVMFGLAAMVADSTIGENEVASDSGDASGGGLVTFSSGDVTLNNVTVAGNVASSGAAGSGRAGGIFNDPAASVTLGNTALVGNTDNSGTGPDCVGTLDSAGYNILGDNTGCTFAPVTGDRVGDVAGGDAPIAALDVFEDGDVDDNGGSIMIDESTNPRGTIALAAGGPAVDAGNPNPVAAGMPPTCSPRDNRGGQRPADGDNDGAAVCDIGAFELGASFGSSGSGGGGGVAVFTLLLLAVSGLVRAVAARVLGGAGSP